MPADYQIDSASRLITLTVTGNLSEAEIRDVERRLTSDPSYDGDFDHLIDVRSGLTLLGSVDVLREMAAKPIVNPGVRRAIVTGHLLAYGLARLFQATHDTAGLGDELRVFFKIENARRWIAARHHQRAAGSG